ncbi:MAG: DNA repair protein RecO [Gemmatimonadaceae bacterium]|nr:DNA repair protein RecO [Gemmatimonadaceae bacterium]
MTVLVTDAIVLHVADYLESSRILRLATRDAGVVSVVARGARNSRKRFGSALDLFAEGQAQLQYKPGKDLQSLHGFEVTRSRPEIAADLERFYAASAVSEVVLRLVHDEAAPSLFGNLSAGFARLSAAPAGTIGAAALATLWQLVADVGYRPTLDSCAACHAEVPEDEPARFNAFAGGVLCANCQRRHPGGRTLPPEARRRIARWLDGGESASEPAQEQTQVQLDDASLRAHQRLAREFLTHQIADNRPLKAYVTWESTHW